MNLPDLDSLETPAALVDEERLEANLQKAAAYMREHGLRWRPHTKTHKMPALAARQFQEGAGEGAVRGGQVVGRWDVTGRGRGRA